MELSVNTVRLCGCRRLRSALTHFQLWESNSKIKAHQIYSEICPLAIHLLFLSKGAFEHALSLISRCPPASQHLWEQGGSLTLLLLLCPAKGMQEAEIRLCFEEIKVRACHRNVLLFLHWFLTRNLQEYKFVCPSWLTHYCP